jgi:hypothetical protein
MPLVIGAFSWQLSISVLSGQANFSDGDPRGYSGEGLFQVIAFAGENPVGGLRGLEGGCFELVSPKSVFLAGGATFSPITRKSY